MARAYRMSIYPSPLCSTDFVALLPTLNRVTLMLPVRSVMSQEDSFGSPKMETTIKARCATVSRDIGCRLTKCLGLLPLPAQGKKKVILTIG